MKINKPSLSMVNLQELFGDKGVLKIPAFQRSYSWTKDNINVLFDDLISEWELKEDYHLGNITLVVPHRFEQHIIDGQQRITTLFFILKEVISRLEEYPKNNFSNKYLNDCDPRGGKIISEKMLTEAEKNVDIPDEIKEEIKNRVDQIDPDKFIDFLLDDVYLFVTKFQVYHMPEIKEELIKSIFKHFINMNTKGKPFDQAEINNLMAYLK